MKNHRMQRQQTAVEARVCIRGKKKQWTLGISADKLTQFDEKSKRSLDSFGPKMIPGNQKEMPEN